MNIVITTFHNPFSFFCMKEGDGKNIGLNEETVQAPSSSSKIEITDVKHSQYVAVMWKNKWTRGLVTMESQFLIWLIDYGIYIRPNERTVYVNLPVEYKKLPNKVFEASIHGVAPVDRVLTDECVIKNQISNKWTAGANEKAQNLIASSLNTYFVPIALMTTLHNDVVVGDLYLELEPKKIVNVVDELEAWPVFLEKNKAAYIENLFSQYTSRRKHRACLLKPVVAKSLPKITIETTLAEYNAICVVAPQFEHDIKCSDESEDGSTDIESSNVFKLTAAEIEKYSNMYIVIADRRMNVLNVLVNKIRDLNMCEKYKDYDLKSIGRGSYRTPPKNRDDI